MSLNTIHNRSRDLIQAKNITKKTSFKCEIWDNVNLTRFEASQGLNFNQLKMVIRVNGNADLSRGDYVEVLGKQYCIASIDTHYSNKMVFKKRMDVANFQGEMVVGLE